MNARPWNRIVSALLLFVSASAHVAGGARAKIMTMKEASQKGTAVSSRFDWTSVVIKRRSRRLLTGNPQTMTDADRIAIVNMLNQYRSETARGQTGSQPAAQSMETLAWDGALESMSTRHIEQCQWAASSGLSAQYRNESNNQAAMFSEEMFIAQGIGLSMSGGSRASALTILQSWFDQHTNYTLSNNSCATGRSCDAYKQIVRAETRFVGCAYKECSVVSVSGQTWNDTTLLTCTWLGYGLSGTPPYAAVTSSNGICSGCRVGRQSCVNGMCSANSPTTAWTTTPTVVPIPSPTRSKHGWSYPESRG